MPGATRAHDPADPLRDIDTSKPHTARIYDVFLGGSASFPVDREAAKAALAHNPRGYLDIRHNRDFLRRAVTHLVTEAGIRQFLDIGTGLPTQDNVHQIAQRLAPESRVVYTDHDPVVLAQARALLASGPQGRTDYLHVDLHEPADILSGAARTLDFDRPVALVLAAILHFVEDEPAHRAAKNLLDALPSGSALIFSHLSDDFNPESARAVAASYKGRGVDFVLRSRERVAEFATRNGLEIVEPGVVQTYRWRPDHAPDAVRLTAEPAGAGDGAEELDELDRTKYLDIHDVTETDINICGMVAVKP
ncbi:SAM-dependent methyltransferase [Streptomyces sp. NPDC001985]|uniref:SAM-dependent methyltransferase n=1 Tax=Streptomyces sp. NPDC001985 TaxID=3154406 RepID=UPI0033235050